MIRIEKPDVPPARLTNQGAKLAARDRQRYDEGKRSFAFSSSIYGHETVKNALLRAQHRKCCFCERRTGHDGDVEHYRPKSSSKQRHGPGVPSLTPGYFWLAYDWNNLFLSCSPCNSRQKGSLFPLSDPSKRARSHHDDLGNELPLFLKPDVENPEDHIGFRGEVPFPKTERGRITIDELGLSRDVLCEERLQLLHELQGLRDVIALASRRAGDAELQRLAQRAESRIARSLSDEGEYAAASRCAEADGYRYVLLP